MRGTTMNAISTRLSAAAGAYFVVAVVAGVLYRTEGGLMVILSGLVALLVFLAFLSRLLSNIGGARTSWPAMTTSFGLIYLAMQASELAYFGVDFQGSATGASANLLSDVIEATFVASTIFFGLFVLSVATGTHAQRVLPAWLTWPGMAVGAVTALAGALGVLAVDSFTPLPYVTGLAWTGILSVVLAFRPSRAVREAASESISGRADAVGRV
jgi:hypothetical protein